MFIFGLSAEQAEARRRSGEFDMHAVVRDSERLAGVVDALRAGVFSPDDPQRYVALVDGLLSHDRFLVCADFDAYWNTQRRVDALWQRPDQWWRAAVLNTARTGWFSSDRTIREYAAEIWHAECS